MAGEDTITEGAAASVTGGFSATPVLGKAWLEVAFTDSSTTGDLIIETGSAPDTITEVA